MSWYASNFTVNFERIFVRSALLAHPQQNEALFRWVTASKRIPGL